MSAAAPLFVGIDVGTTAVKVSVIDDRGAVHAEASVGHPTNYVRRSWVEQNPEDWWDSTCGALAIALNSLSLAQRASISGIGVSSQAPTLLPLDSAFRPLRPAMIWMDRRSEAQSAAIGREFGDENVLATTANRVDPFFVAPKLRWLRDREPDILERTAVFLQINGYIVLRLTGELSLDGQHASLLGLRRQKNDDWWPEMLAAVGVTSDHFPEISSATTVVGQVTATASGVTGLPVGIPVVAGTVDSGAAALEAAVTRNGQAAEMTGTSTVVVMPSDAPTSSGEFITMLSTLPDQWLSLAAMVASGASLNWLKQITREPDGFDAMVATAGDVRPGADGLIFLPYMMGERSPIWNTDARGVFVGLSLATDTARLTRSVLEGTAFSLRHNLDRAARAGLEVSELRTLGGGARSDIWCQIKADVTGIPIVRMKAPTGATFGCAALAAVGVGAHDNLASFVNSAARVDRTFEPRPSFTARYTPFYDSYLRSYISLKSEFTELATLSESDIE